MYQMTRDHDRHHSPSWPARFAARESCCAARHAAFPFRKYSSVYRAHQSTGAAVGLVLSDRLPPLRKENEPQPNMSGQTLSCIVMNALAPSKRTADSRLSQLLGAP
jgi:hypothetical protein